MKYNKIKQEQLGMNHSTAQHQLRKKILFSLIQELGRDICFQCDKRIHNIDNFSIEHKEPWLYSNNAREKFFDLNNIAFSHLSCNCGAGRRYRIECPDGKYYCYLCKNYKDKDRFCKEEHLKCVLARFGCRVDDVVVVGSLDGDHLHVDVVGL